MEYISNVIKQKQQLGENGEQRKGATAVRGGCRVEREENRERGRERQREGYGDRGREVGIFEERVREMMRESECGRCIQKLIIMIGQN